MGFRTRPTATGAYLTGAVLGIPAFLVLGKVFVVGIPALAAALEVLL